MRVGFFQTAKFQVHATKPLDEFGVTGTEPNGVLHVLDRKFLIISVPEGFGQSPVRSVIRLRDLECVGEQRLGDLPLAVMHRLKTLAGEPSSGDRLPALTKPPDCPATRFGDRDHR